jgi:methyl-accepting chemotaxis protein
MHLLDKLLASILDSLPLGKKLSRVNLFLLGSTALAITLFFPTVQKSLLMKHLESQARMACELSVREIGESWSMGDSLALTAHLRDLASTEAVDWALMLDNEGRVLAGTGDLAVLAREARLLMTAPAGQELLQSEGRLLCGRAVPAGNGEGGRLVLALPMDKVEADVALVRLLALALSVAGMFTGVLTFTLVVRRIVKPIHALSETAKRVAAGDHGVQAPVLSRDEIGDLAQAFNSMLDSLRGTLQELKEQRDDLNHSVEALLKAMSRFAGGDLSVRVDIRRDDDLGRLCEGFNASVDSLRTLVSGLTESGGQLTAEASRLMEIANTMLNDSRENDQRSRSMAVMSKSVDAGVQGVAGATRQMESTVAEIARNSGDAARMAMGAVGLAEQAGKAIHKLGESSREIGDVVKVIAGIAAQTQLLALNATIEAARAGAAGKGFAVVADEVKDLATETTRATEGISARVARIQADTGTAVEAIDSINQAIARMNELQTVVAGAVEEQAATTSEIGHNLEEAAAGSASISTSASQVQEAATRSSTDAQGLQQAAASLAGVAQGLVAAVRRFTV